MNPWLSLILALVLAGLALRRLAGWLNLRAAQPEPPPALAAVLDAERYARSLAYLRANHRLGAVYDLVSTGVLLAFLLGGGFGWVDSLVRTLGLGPVATGLLYAGVLALCSDLFGLPFAVYRTFRLEVRFGFNRSRPGTFVADLLKGWLITATLGGALGAAVLWLFESLGPVAWWWCWAAVAVFSAGVAFLAPVLLLPLFYRFTPLPIGELRDAIAALAERMGFRNRGVFVVDGSRRSTKANAFFTGFGSTRRIALFDTLLERHPPGEILAVLAHEIGHSRLRHVSKQFAVGLATTGLMLWLASLFLRFDGLTAAFGLRIHSVYGSLVAFGFLYAPITLVLGVAGHALSRRFERAADARAAEACGSLPLASALVRLGIDSLVHPTPHPFYVWLYYSHPPLLDRLRTLGVERVDTLPPPAPTPSLSGDDGPEPPCTETPVRVNTAAGGEPT